MWEPRLGRQGTRDQRWAMFRAPLPPQDFDPRFANAAPDDQQLPEGFFRGDETVTLTGLHRSCPVYEAMLPGQAPPRVRARPRGRGCETRRRSYPALPRASSR